MRVKCSVQICFCCCCCRCCCFGLSRAPYCLPCWKREKEREIYGLLVWNSNLYFGRLRCINRGTCDEARLGLLQKFVYYCIKKKRSLFINPFFYREMLISAIKVLVNNPIKKKIWHHFYEKWKKAIKILITIFFFHKSFFYLNF